jgi:hypothetical protein
VKPPTITNGLLHTKKKDQSWTAYLELLDAFSYLKPEVDIGIQKENFGHSTLRCIARHSPDFHDSKSMSS